MEKLTMEKFTMSAVPNFSSCISLEPNQAGTAPATALQLCLLSRWWLGQANSNGPFSVFLLCDPPEALAELTTSSSFQDEAHAWFFIYL